MQARTRSILLSLIFTVPGLFLPGHLSAAVNNCEFAFKTGFFGSLKPSFKHNDNYSNELKQSIDIKDQCGLGTCHLHSWVTSLEKSYESRTSKQIELNTRYLAFTHWLGQVLKAFQDPKTENLKMSLGASVFDSRKAIQNFGLVPEGLWKPKVQFDDPVVSHRLQEFVSNRIMKMKWDMDREINPSKKAKIKIAAGNDLEEIFASVGPLPQKFMYEGNEYTPQTFAHSKFPELFEPTISAYVAHDRKERTEVIDDGEFGDVFARTDLETVERLVREALDDGKSVYLSYDHNKTFVDNKTGIMSIEALNLPNGAGPLSRVQRDNFEVKPGGHAVQIIGYDLNPETGKVVKWKIQNSWGEDAGDHGIYHMYEDYFRAFVIGITFSRKAKVNLPKSETHSEFQPGLPLTFPPKKN